SAEGVERQYAKISAQAVRAASYRALAAEYARDLYGEQLEQAEQDVGKAESQLAATGRQLAEVRSERELLSEEHQRAQLRLQGSQGYGEQARFDELAERDRDRLQQLKRELLRELGFVR